MQIAGLTLALTAESEKELLSNLSSRALSHAFASNAEQQRVHAATAPRACPIVCSLKTCLSLFLDWKLIFIRNSIRSELQIRATRIGASNAIARLARRRMWFSPRRSICAERSIYCRSTANRKTNNAAENFRTKNAFKSDSPTSTAISSNRIGSDQSEADFDVKYGTQRSLLFPHADKSVACSTLGGENGRMMETDETRIRALNRRRHNSWNEGNTVRTKLCLDEQFSYNGRSFRFSFSSAFFITALRSLREIKLCLKLFEITGSTICVAPGKSPNVN